MYNCLRDKSSIILYFSTCVGMCSMYAMYASDLCKCVCMCLYMCVSVYVCVCVYAHVWVFACVYVHLVKCFLNHLSGPISIHLMTKLISHSILYSILSIMP